MLPKCQPASSRSGWLQGWMIGSRELRDSPEIAQDSLERELASRLAPFLFALQIKR